MCLGLVVNKNYKWIELKVLRSIVGDSVQDRHADFDKNEMETLEDGQFQVSALAPLSYAAKLHIRTKVVSIEVGQVIYFAPRVVHGRVSYDHVNHQIFGKLGFVSE